MDAFLTKLSYHATSYAIRSCLALTSTYVIKQGSRLLETVEDDPLRLELSHLQRRLARKIELISPILDSIEFRYSKGNSALEAVVRTARELRQDIDSLGKRLENAALVEEISSTRTSRGPTAIRRAQLLSIIAETKDLIVNIDDSIPIINLWMSAIGGIQAQPTSFSPSRLLQASMLVNVGDTQYVIDPSRPMQIGPDFTLSLYMLFRAHASPQEATEPYGVEEGQRKPMWQEVIHKARVRLYRVPLDNDLFPVEDGPGTRVHKSFYAYRLQIVEDLNDDRVHSFDVGDAPPGSYDGVPLAGIREFIPVGQIAKMFYADVGKILNIGNDQDSTSNPVLLLKRDLQASPLSDMRDFDSLEGQPQHLIAEADISIRSDSTLEEEGDTQTDIDRQIREESEKPSEKPLSAIIPSQKGKTRDKDRRCLPPDLDPEWLAFEVFALDEEEEDDTDSLEDKQEGGLTPDVDADSDTGKSGHLRHISRPSVDSNLVTQLGRMSIAAATASSASSRPSSRDSQPRDPARPDTTPNRTQSSTSSTTANTNMELSPTHLLERSPFGAIKTSLSLLEMLLRLTSLQEFEQTTHLSIPDHVLRFYLDESSREWGSARGDSREEGARF